MVDTFTKFYKKIANSGNDSDYELVGTIGVDGVPLSIMQGCTSSNSGEIGLVPKSTNGQQNHVLTGDGTWKNVNSILGNAVKLVDGKTYSSNISNLRENYTVNFMSYRYVLVLIFQSGTIIDSKLLPVTSSFGSAFFNYGIASGSSLALSITQIFLTNFTSSNKITIGGSIIYAGNYNYKCEIYGIK